MKRTCRPEFDFDRTTFAAMPAEQQNWRLFDWWCDADDHAKLIAALGGRPLKFKTRAPRQDDPAPPMNQPAPQGFRDAWLISSPADIDRVLSSPDDFSNISYAALGGGSFLLGQDPSSGDLRHEQQVAFVKAALAPYTNNPPGLAALAKTAVEQAALTALVSPDFDLAAFAEQAGLRYLSLLYGYGFQDHVLLQEASRAAYRALQYIAVGEQFATDPIAVPAAQQAVGQLIARTSELMEEYSSLGRSPRRFGTPDCRSWPTGVQPWSELGLSCLGIPLLKSLDRMDDPLSGRDRALVSTMLLAGTLGNVQSAICLLVEALWRRSDATRLPSPWPTGEALDTELARIFCELRPITVLPRRTRNEVRFDDQVIPADTDCLILLEGSSRSHRGAPACPHAWGRTREEPPEAVHPCLGRELSWPLIVAVVQHVAALPGLAQALDPLTGDVLGIGRLWGFACTQYPLHYDRERRHRQQNLIISMQVKVPVAQNAAALRQLLAASVPRVESVLTGFAGVHFAWFEFTTDDSRLVLRTIYDGQFEAYVRHFAIRAGDLFDGLFQFLEDAPPLPVAEHPDDFVETLRSLNQTPLAGYLYSAYPGVTVAEARQAGSLG